MPTYKLMYFNGRGRAEVARMMFHLKGQDFEDSRFEGADWRANRKGDTKLYPLSQVPVLLVDGHVMPQSRAINRYLAREFGFYGENNKEATHIDVITETGSDIFEKIALFFQLDDAKKAEAQKELKETTSKPLCTFLEDSLRKAGGKYFVGKSVTLADLEIFTMLDMLHDSVVAIEGFVEQYPDLLKFYKGIKEDSPLKSYLKSRPTFPF